MKFFTRIPTQAFIAVLAATGLGACGGGSENAEGFASVNPSPPSPLPPAPPPPPPPPPSPPPPAASPQGYNLVWSEEFNGNALSSKCWSYWWNPTNTPNEMQAYTSNQKNTVVKDGMLNLAAHKENVTAQGKTYSYSSSQIYSGGKGMWTYGRFEARIRIPKGAGVWPAFWLLPQDNFYGGWPLNGEIDIVEWIGPKPRVVYNTVHGPGPGGSGHASTTKEYTAAADVGDDFHTYGLEWTPTGMKYFFDGAQINEITTWPQPTGAAFPAPFDRPFYIVLNLGIGGDWPGPPDANTVFPSTMLVDWVRVYQKSTTSTAAPASSCS
ncbi:MAG: glycoside hydrolase family 16 protein [Hyphomonadaceae bacterium]|nr:glycoside hydrolase family 16 protein [Hyphomonadaceae bacterium]